MNLATYFSEQARRPSGWFGRIVMPIVFDRGNAFLNRFVNTSIAVEPDDRVLEIGCGTGKLIAMMAQKINNGSIEGIDFSSEMVTIAKRRNRNHIARGTVVIVADDFDRRPYTESAFTKACSVNTLYFWNNPEKTVKKIMRLLESGGSFVLGFEDIRQLQKRNLNTDVFQFFHTKDVQLLLTSCGFSKHRIESKAKHNLLFHCIVATK